MKNQKVIKLSGKMKSISFGEPDKNDFNEFEDTCESCVNNNIKEMCKECIRHDLFTRKDKK